MAREKHLKTLGGNQHNVLVVSDFLHKHEKGAPRQCPVCKAQWSALENKSTDQVDVWKDGSPANDLRLDIAGNNVAVKCCTSKGTEYTDREVLEIFIESVGELLSSEFLQAIKQNGISTEFTWVQDGQFVSQITGPRREAVKAFLLTLRFFCQDNERTSLRNMAELVAKLNVDESLKNQFFTVRDILNKFLDEVLSPVTFKDREGTEVRAAPVTFGGLEGTGTRREIFESFLWGIFAHATPEYRRRVKSWEGQPYHADLQAHFDAILLNFLGALSSMADLCCKMLKEIA